jgi:hypothetical protein
MRSTAGTQILQVGILQPLAGGQFSFFKISLTTAIMGSGFELLTNFNKV